MDPLVRADEIQRTYQTQAGHVRALRGVTASIHPGEIVAIHGPSGCGKTTLLNCLSGIDTPTEGTVTFQGQRLDTLPDAKRTRLRSEHMGFVFQAFNLIQVLNATENTELPLLLNGTPSKAAKKRAIGALTRVGLADRADHLPNQLSGGEQQRIALARSLVNDPSIVWADEPTGNLDKDTGKSVLRLIQHLNQDHGQTYVIVTHDPKVLDIAHRTLRMESGRLARQNPREA